MSWQNKIYTGDCLYVLHGLDTDSADLIYLDPPFNSNRIFSAPIGSKAAGSSFDDMWTWNDVDKTFLEEMIVDYPFLVNFIQSIDVIHSKSMKSYITYMAQRLIEMKRVLKDEGSIYLHCDPTAAHYLKIVCDRIFNKKNFASQIIWKRNSSHNDSKSFGNVSDTILFYGQNINTEDIRVPLKDDYVKKFYKHSDSKGLYQADNLSAKGLSGGGYEYDFHGHMGPWRFPEKRMKELEANDLIHFPKKAGGVPRKKRYLQENKGQVPSNIWDDIPAITAHSKEKTGYPTQKPLKLLERIIKASTKEGDLVIDPFCGCATACVAAQQLNRKWIGIDVEPNSAQIVSTRIMDDAGLFTNFIHIDCIKDPKNYPARSDAEKISKKSAKERLYEEQKGKCNGCETKFEIRHFQVDHRIPKSKGGPDTYENYQLLCGSCNQIKGNRPMAYLKMRIDQINDSMNFRVSFGEND